MRVSSVLSCFLAHLPAVIAYDDSSNYNAYRSSVLVRLPKFLPFNPLGNHLHFGGPLRWIVVRRGGSKGDCLPLNLHLSEKKKSKLCLANKVRSSAVLLLSLDRTRSHLLTP